MQGDPTHPSRRDDAAPAFERDDAVLARLRAAGLRPTRQRLSLGRLLLESGDRHVSAEVVHAEAQAAGVRVSLATVYNTLHQFTEAGLLREVVVEPGRTWFDTNTRDHHHIFIEDEGELIDVPADALTLSTAPDLPAGAELRRVDVVIRVARR